MSENRDSQDVLLKGAIVVVIFVVAGLAYAYMVGSKEPESHPLLTKDGEAKPTREPEDPFPDSDSEDEKLSEFNPTSGSVKSPESVDALPVPGDPLLVTLPAPHDSLGQISIEKYDSEGQPTGRPLKSGTPVQIPDPNWSGERIYFKVP